MKNAYCLGILLIITFCGCKKDEVIKPSDYPTLLKNTKWLLYSVHEKGYYESSKKVDRDTSYLYKCSSGETLEFFDENKVILNKPCIFLYPITGKWSLKNEDELTVDISVPLPSTSGYTSWQIGFFGARIMEVTKNQFKVKLSTVVYIDQTTKYIREDIRTYNKEK